MIKRLPPIAQIALGLVSLTGMLILFADLFFKILPDPQAEQLQLRKRLGEGLAVQVAVLVQSRDRDLVEQTLREVMSRNPEIRSLAVRRAEDSFVAKLGDHDRYYRTPKDGRSDNENVFVPLNASGKRWGSFEISYKPDETNAVLRAAHHPFTQLVVFLSTAGVLVYFLFMRRVLQRLDPSSVIPDRVRMAFDAMTEGVVVIDHQTRIVLANLAFRQLQDDSKGALAGRLIGELPLLSGGLPAESWKHPWAISLQQNAPQTGFTIDIHPSDGEARRLIVNCAPIIDAQGASRGCMVTFDDVTALQRANEQLHQVLVELQRSRREIEAKNTELERLATRDHLSGCLNRRTFGAQAAVMFGDARIARTRMSVVMLDIDHFKSINDRFGHGVGDRVIQQVAKIMMAGVRNEDLVCRYGGEEFVIALPGMDIIRATALADRLRRGIQGECGPGIRDVNGLLVTASFGVAMIDHRSNTIEELIDRADSALYTAKNNGRNRVYAAPGNTGAESPAAQSPA